MMLPCADNHRTKDQGPELNFLSSEHQFIRLMCDKDHEFSYLLDFDILRYW